jgi:hypothetical protein
VVGIQGFEYRTRPAGMSSLRRRLAREQARERDVDRGEDRMALKPAVRIELPIPMAVFWGNPVMRGHLTYAILVCPNHDNEARDRPNIPLFPKIRRTVLDA